MAWKVLQNLKTDILHKAGEVLQTLEGLAEDEIKKLEQEGILQNLETDAKQDASQVEDQAKQDLATAEAQAKQDAELARGQVEDQLHQNVQKDLADAEKIASAPGRPLVNNQAKPGQPTPEEIAKTAEGVQ